MKAPKLDIKSEIKAYIIASGKTMKEVNTALGEAKGSVTVPQNLSNKLANETLSYADAKRIADICGYTIEWKRN